MFKRQLIKYDDLNFNIQKFGRYTVNENQCGYAILDD